MNQRPLYRGFSRSIDRSHLVCCRTTTTTPCPRLWQVIGARHRRILSRTTIEEVHELLEGQLVASLLELAALERRTAQLALLLLQVEDTLLYGVLNAAAAE